MKIQNSQAEDVDQIFELYTVATKYQKEKGEVAWPEISRDLVTQEILENRQWKLTIENEIACIWAVTYSDPQIWQEKNDDPAIYIHRISTHPKHRGRGLVKQIVSWAQDFAKQHHKKYIRMDTVGENKGLIQYYKKCGFSYLGLSKLNDTEGLPGHYHDATVCLFEMPV